jgi:hypothetical protein
MKSRDALLAVLLVALSPLPASADSFCGPGLKLGAENDCRGCSWLCIPDNNPLPISQPTQQSPGGASLLLEQAASQVEMTDGLSNISNDPNGMGLQSRDFNRRAIEQMRRFNFLRASLLFSVSASYAKSAGNMHEEYVNRRNERLMSLARELKSGIDAERLGKMTQAQVSYRRAKVVAAEIARMPQAVAAAPLASVVPAHTLPTQAAVGPNNPPAIPGSDISGVGDPSGAAPGSGPAKPALRQAGAPIYRTTTNRQPPAVTMDPIGQVVVPLLKLAQPAQRTQPPRQAPTHPSPVAVVQPRNGAIAPDPSTISQRSPLPATGAPLVRTPVRSAPIGQPPATGGVRQPAVVQLPPPSRSPTTVGVQVPLQVPTGSPYAGIDPRPVASVPDPAGAPGIDYSGMDPVALVNAYGTHDPDYSGGNAYNPDPNAGHVAPGVATNSGPNVSPDPVPQYGGGTPVASVRDPDIVCAGGPCTGGSGQHPTGSPVSDPGAAPVGSPGGGVPVVDPGADPNGNDDLGGVSVYVVPTSRPMAESSDLRNKVLMLRR